MGVFGCSSIRGVCDADIGCCAKTLRCARVHLELALGRRVSRRISRSEIRRSSGRVPQAGRLPSTWKPPSGGDRALGLVDFAMFPHLEHEDLPDNSMANAEKWAASVPVPGYAIDDQTAIKVTDGAVEVVSEGQWKLFTP